VTHENAVYNAVAISHLLGTQAPQQLGLCWLPLYHDMGLVGNVLSVLYSRMPMMLMAPSTFLKRPDMFLQLVARHRVTHVAAPNFAYELCARKLPDAVAHQLDLSHLRVYPPSPQFFTIDSHLRVLLGCFSECGLFISSERCGGLHRWP
jgi:acyl-CoA synthetase (AMP-forming)/AMP-acid ligase II